jgi:hypothetical protein
MDSVDKKYREKEEVKELDITSGHIAYKLYNLVQSLFVDSGHIAYKGYMANNGVHPLMMRRAQADYLDTFSNHAQLFYLAFTHVDGDGIANGIARHILSYVSGRTSDGKTKKKKKKKKKTKKTASEEL